jgi:glycosyltransferase involved in cell wall biosynthesis
MKLSVIICTYNRSGILDKTLKSLEQVEVPGDVAWEVLIIDNGSTDNTPAIVQGYIKNNKIPVFYFLEAASGKSAALNLGIQKSRGEIIAFTDDDVLLDKKWVNAILNAVSKYPYSAFGGRIIALWGSPIPSRLSSAGKFNSLSGTVFFRDDGEIDREYNEAMIGNVPCGANMFFRREAIESNGFFRTDLGPSHHVPGASEDTEFCSRMLKLGRKFMYVANAVIYHPVDVEKISPGALLRWRYYCAKSEVRAREFNKSMNRIYGVPRYLFRQFISNAVIWLMSSNSSKRFFFKLKTYYTWGEIIEHRSISKGAISK